MKVNFFWRIFLNTKKEIAAEKIWKNITAEVNLNPSWQRKISFPATTVVKYNTYYKDNTILITATHSDPFLSLEDTFYRANCFLQKFVYTYRTGGPVVCSNGNFDIDFDVNSANERMRVCGVEMVALHVSGRMN